MSRESDMKSVSDREQNLWNILSGLFEGTPENVAENAPGTVSGDPSGGTHGHTQKSAPGTGLEVAPKVVPKSTAENTPGAVPKIVPGTVQGTAPSETVAARLLAEGFTQMDAIRHAYFAVVAPGMSLLRLTEKNRRDAFSRAEIDNACFQFHRQRYTRFLIHQFGRFVCYRAGGVPQRWDGLEKALLRQLAMGNWYGHKPCDLA